MQIEISTRHGGLDAEQHRYLHDKAEKLLKYFGRLMAIEVAVDHVKHAWKIEILVSAEHKHDFVARENGPDAGSGDGRLRPQDRKAAPALQGEGAAPQGRRAPWGTDLAGRWDYGAPDRGADDRRDLTGRRPGADDLAAAPAPSSAARLGAVAAA